MEENITLTFIPLWAKSADDKLVLFLFFTRKQDMTFRLCTSETLVPIKAIYRLLPLPLPPPPHTHTNTHTHTHPPLPVFTGRSKTVFLFIDRSFVTHCGSKLRGFFHISPI